MEEWKNGRMEGWKRGRLEGWKGGRVEEWKRGRMEEWKKRGIGWGVCRCFRLLSYFVQQLRSRQKIHQYS